MKREERIKKRSPWHPKLKAHVNVFAHKSYKSRALWPINVNFPPFVTQPPIHTRANRTARSLMRTHGLHGSFPYKWLFISTPYSRQNYRAISSLNIPERWLGKQTGLQNIQLDWPLLPGSHLFRQFLDTRRPCHPFPPLPPGSNTTLWNRPP